MALKSLSPSSSASQSNTAIKQANKNIIASIIRPLLPPDKNIVKEVADVVETNNDNSLRSLGLIIQRTMIKLTEQFLRPFDYYWSVNLPRNDVEEDELSAEYAQDEFLKEQEEDSDNRFNDYFNDKMKKLDEKYQNEKDKDGNQEQIGKREKKEGKTSPNKIKKQYQNEKFKS
ncbi:MAG: hypothetical protein EZS28_028823 [Streblomastix strix]|uniref:Uncharacterized protein n=1 Tax=Streblomastix strix TaxID=222440 RepID=A0A5J4V0Q9_9EUKA|nr:MAG: hypothetical protein EZS28_028823 [Streblomastix strix]